MKTIFTIFALFLFSLPPNRVEIQQFPILDDFDLTDVEGQRLHFNPQHVDNLRIIVCGDHFRKNLQAFRNVRKVVRLYNTTPYIKVKFRPLIKRTQSHNNEADLYQCGTNRHQIFDNNDIYICFAESEFNIGGCGIVSGDPSATAYVAKYVDTDQHWTCCNNRTGVPFDKAILRLRKRDFNQYFDDDGQSDKAPSAGIISHEIAHMLHMGHYSKNGERNPKRAPYYQIFDGLCNGVANFNHCSGASDTSFHQAFDLRKPRMTAYSRAVFNAIYPMASSEVEDVKYEWTIHDILTFRDNYDLVSGKSIKFFGEMNSSKLYWNGTELIDEDKDEDEMKDKREAREAHFFMQFSNPSNKHSPLLNPKIKIKISLNDNLGNSVVLVQREINIRHNGTLTQFNARARTNTNLITNNFNVLVGNNYTLRYEIDPDNQYTEFNESNNSLEHPVEFRL